MALKKELAIYGWMKEQVCVDEEVQEKKKWQLKEGHLNIVSVVRRERYSDSNFGGLSRFC